MKGNSCIIGIGGATCSGKTSLVERLCREHDHMIPVHQDLFYQEEALVPKSTEGYTLWDDTAALDWTRLIQHVETVCLHPEHYCVSCREMNSFDQNSPHLVLVEGTQVLSARNLLDLYDLQFFLTLDYVTCSDRRRARLDYQDLPGFFECHVWPVYCQTEAAVRMIKTVTLLDGRDETTAIYNRIASTCLPMALVQTAQPQ